MYVNKILGLELESENSSFDCLNQISASKCHILIPTTKSITQALPRELFIFMSNHVKQLQFGISFSSQNFAELLSFVALIPIHTKLSFSGEKKSSDWNVASACCPSYSFS